MKKIVTALLFVLIQMNFLYSQNTIIEGGKVPFNFINSEKEFDEVIDYYKGLKCKYGFQGEIPEHVLYSLGLYQGLRLKNYNEAFRIFSYFFEKYPESAAAYNGLGEICRSLNMLKTAENYFEYAVKISENRFAYFKDNLVNIKKVILGAQENQGFPEMSGKYMGQTPPGLIPEIFAPGIISARHNESGSVFSPDGREFYFAVAGIPVITIMFMKQENNVWLKPEVMPFTGRYSNFDMSLSPDGKTMFFSSYMPIVKTGKPKKDTDLWKVKRTENGWSNPVWLGDKINSDKYEFYPWCTEDGTLYFTSDKEGGEGDGDLYRSKLIGNEYSEPVNLGKVINSENYDGDAYVSPDEDFIIITCWDRPDGYGESDLYITFKKNDGTWTQLKNMGKKINSEEMEHGPMITNDGRYFFFTSTRNLNIPYAAIPVTKEVITEAINHPYNGRGNIFWVDACVIEELRKSVTQN